MLQKWSIRYALASLQPPVNPVCSDPGELPNRQNEATAVLEPESTRQELLARIARLEDALSPVARWSMETETDLTPTGCGQWIQLVPRKSGPPPETPTSLPYRTYCYELDAARRDRWQRGSDPGPGDVVSSAAGRRRSAPGSGAGAGHARPAIKPHNALTKPAGRRRALSKDCRNTSRRFNIIAIRHWWL
jgi:hypothetical protein